MRSLASAAVVLVAASCASAPSKEEAPDADAPPEVAYAVRFLPGPQWVAGKPLKEQPGIGAHISSMQALAEKGALVCGGPFLDGTGGLAVVRAASPQEADALVRTDESVTGGLLVPEIHPWLLAMAPGLAPKR